MKRFLVAALMISAPAFAAPLPEDAAGRRAIRGGPVDVPVESESLRELRRFEEESFPKAIVYAPILNGEDGAIPVPPAPHTSTESPPTSLTSPTVNRAEPDSEAVAIPWLATLKLPDMPVRWDARTVRYLEFYRDDKRGHAIMAGWLRRQGRYRGMIEEALRKAKLPSSLLYVSMIESGYDPLDKSSAGAAGLWQFMVEGGRIYGLRIDHWVDERRDPEKSTEAVLHYFGDLQARFGSWHLALAAFNAGYGSVLRSVAKYNTNDYWELSRHEDGLPWETTLYVPKALAAAVVGENREALGYGEITPDPPLEFDRVSVPSSTSFAAMAKAAGVSEKAIAELNPELKRNRTPPESWTARVPKGTGAKFAAAFEKNREKLRNHVVRFGERLDELARSCGSSATELKRLNGIDDLASVRPGLTLVVPDGRAPLPVPSEEAVAIIAVPDKGAAVAGKKRVFYRLLPGDTQKDVAAFFKVAPNDLARWNNLDDAASFTSKMVLQIWVAPEFDVAKAALLDPARVRVVTVGSEEFFDLVEARAGRKRIEHVVKAGDTLQRIAKKYHLTEADLERINRFGRKSELKVGQKIRVYVAMTEAERKKAEAELTPGGAAPDQGDDDGDDGVTDDPAPSAPSQPAPATGERHPLMLAAPVAFAIADSMNHAVEKLPGDLPAAPIDVAKADAPTPLPRAPIAAP
jgi:membrane-bound lytic murein transglycosylase D